MNSNVLAGITLAVVIVIGGYVVTHGGQQGPKGPQGPEGIQGTAGQDGSNGADGVAGRNGSNGANGKDGASSQKFGAVVSSQALSSPLCTDGNCAAIIPRFFTAATDTPIDIVSPNATTSLKRLLCQTTQSTSTALTLRLATSTIYNATTTSLTTFPIVGMGSFVYIPTATASIYAPKTHLVLDIEGVGFLTTTLVGSCVPEWQTFGTPTI